MYVYKQSNNAPKIGREDDPINAANFLTVTRGLFVAFLLTELS